MLYPPAICLPILRLERLGQSSESSVWGGSVGLLADGELLVGGVVFLCSVVLPLCKLVLLFLLSLAPACLSRPRRAGTWRALELVGRWGMLDVLLVAVVVAWLKLGDLVQVTPGPAALLFASCVLASLLASAWFDPHALWSEQEAEGS
jgi:paraquat-inducible protein A